LQTEKLTQIIEFIIDLDDSTTKSSLKQAAVVKNASTAGTILFLIL
jgi:hypothetical protein